jgi:hypothetical protein
MKTYNLFLDDIRHPYDCINYRTKLMPENKSMYSQEPWVIVRNYAEFVEEITKRFWQGEFPKLISFDHDLADSHYDPGMYDGSYPEEFEEKTGKDCAKWLLDFCIERKIAMPDFIVHSMNPIGAQRIQDTLLDWFKYQDKFGDS